MAERELEEDENLGLGYGPDKQVCAACVEDFFLAEYISNNASELSCDYCNGSTIEPSALKLVDLSRWMATVIVEEWTDPSEGMPHDDEDGYLFPGISGIELLEQIGFSPESDQLIGDIAEFFSGQNWCKRNPMTLSPSERLQSGWQQFCQVCQNPDHDYSNDFGNPDDEGHPDYLPPAGMLPEVEIVIRNIGLIRQYPIGTKYWRGFRHQPSENYIVPARFASPTIEQAVQPNRFSTAGDPMFYGADNFETARLEVCGKKNDRSKVFSAVQFESCRALHIVDLTDPEFDASFFQPKGGQTRKNVAFLRYFAVAISKEARKDEVQHLDYLPTQTLTSHFRQSLKSDSGIPIDGIRYRSSIDRQPCVVLFFDQVDCLRSRAGRNQAIAYVDATIRHHADS